jgi:Zn-dependent protease with chaperone function
MKNRRPLPLHSLIVTLGVTLMLAASVAAQTQVKRGFNLFSKDQDVEIGAKGAGEIEAQLPVLDDAEVTAFVNDMAQRLVAVSQGPKFPYSFKVVNVADINAFALPGGPIYMHRGTIEAAKNDGELAGVLAHEIAHVALRHGTHEMSKAVRAQVLVGLAAGAIGGNVESIVNQFGGFGLQALFLKFSRKAETESDIVGVQTLVKAGFDPADMVSFFETLQNQDKQRVAEWMSSHPLPENRMTRIQKESTLLKVVPRTAAAPPPSDAMRRVLERLKKLPPAPTMAELKKEPRPAGGTNAPDGGTNTPGGTVTPGTVARPSTTFRAHVSRDRAYRVSAPDDWQIVQEGDSSFALAPAGGSTRTSGATEVTWGAMFGRVAARAGVRSPTLDMATDDLVKALLDGSSYLRVASGSRRSFRDDAGDGRAVTMTGENPRTRLQERIEIVTRSLGGGEAAYMLFVTDANPTKEWTDTLRSMVASFRPAAP